MKNTINKLLIYIAALWLLLNSNSVFAHFVGPITYLKVNNKLTSTYIVPFNGQTVASLYIPVHIAPENYLVNTQVHFSYDAFSLGVPDLDKHVSWDFGDGQTVSGLNVEHSYKVQGSFIVLIKMDEELKRSLNIPRNENNILDSVLVNIVPTVDFKLPKAIIGVNNSLITDPLTQITKAKLNIPVNLHSRDSETGSSKISSVSWVMLPEEELVTDTETSITLSNLVPTVYAILRVKDAGGFISDTYVQIKNESAGKDVNQSSKSINQNRSKNPELSDQTKVLENKISALFSGKKISISALILILAFAFIAGAGHALTPGHGKSIMAAFLVGKGDSKFKDILILASSMTFTHTAIIYIMGFILIVVNSSYQTQQLVPILSKLSAVVVAIIAINLINKGYKEFRHKKEHEHGHDHSHPHVSEANGIKSLLLAGISGGLSPCIDALALLLLSVSINQVLFGMLLVFIFSLGLASCIVLLGIMVIYGKSKFIRINKIGSFFQIYAPIISGIFILMLTMVLLLK